MKQHTRTHTNPSSPVIPYVKWGKSGNEAEGDLTDPHSSSSDEFEEETETKIEAVAETGAGEKSEKLPSVRTAHDRPLAVLAGCNIGMKAEKYTRAIAELRGLAQACGLEPVSTITQNAGAITHATYLGSGKVSDLKKEVESYDADIVIFNESLSPMQMRNLEKILDTEVLDRTGLILQIFASRARTREARLQVESAQLQYMLPRLVGMRAELSRQGGGSGRLSNKGAGEQKLELDRRRIERRIAELDRELKVVSRERNTQRSRRMQTGMTRVALVGYTNAGKSTVMNALLRYCTNKNTKALPESPSDRFSQGGFRKKTGSASNTYNTPSYSESFTRGKQVFEADMLFATLDTSVRRIDASGTIPFLLSDTVGFVSDLPHSLVKAFQSTLDEVCCADLLLEVVDFSDPDYREQIAVTAKTLEEIGAGHIPVVYLYNKTDLALEAVSMKELSTEAFSMEELPAERVGRPVREAGEAMVPQKSRPVPESIPYRRGDILYLAAGRGIGIPEILDLIDDALKEDRVTADFLFPYSKGSLLQEIRSLGAILSQEYLPDGIAIKARCRKKDADRIRRLCLK